MTKRIALVCRDANIVRSFRMLFPVACGMQVFTDVLALTQFLRSDAVRASPDVILIDAQCAAQPFFTADFRAMKKRCDLYFFSRPCARRQSFPGERVLRFPDDLPLVFGANRTAQTITPEQAETERVLSRFIGTSAQANAVRQQILRAASHDMPVLITGETGTGKGLASELIHALSSRHASPLQTVNMAAIPEGLSESALFGTVRGAFTDAVTRAGYFESADGSTLFLDEIGDLRRDVQAKLLHVIENGTFRSVGSAQEKKTDARLIFATNADLQEKMRRGEFREDLYYRISAVCLHIPPLRERREDIRALSRAYLAHHGKRLSRSAERLLMAADWQGNVRHLHHALSRAVMLTDTAVIEPHCIFV